MNARVPENGARNPTSGSRSEGMIPGVLDLTLT